MADAAKKKTSGVIFTVRVDTKMSASLGIGVKDLQDKLLTVSMLKRVNGVPGPVEQAGVRLGDIVFGVNFQPCREGSRTLLQTVKREKERKRHTIHLQCWRCKQLCSDRAPGALFPRVDEMLVQAYAMFRTKVFSDWERWNFVEILLDHMVEDLKTRTTVVSAETLASPPPPLPRSPTARAATCHQLQVQNQILDLEHNILQAKGLRTALCVRVVHTRVQAEAVIYVLRVEDVETGLQWVVHRRYRDFASLNDELADMSHFTKDVAFPRKHLTSSKNSRIIEERIVALEQFLRRVLHVLTLYATMDPLASRSLRHLQNFLGVDRYIDCIHPPLVDDQRCIELMAYRILSDFSSPACQQCIRFVSAVDLNSLVQDGPNGYKPMLKHLAMALAEVEAFVLEHHLSQMLQSLASRKPDYSEEQCRVFVRRCVRRQVEAAIYLPLRRNVFRIVYSFVAVQAQCMQRAMGLLQQAAPDYFEVDAFILQTQAMPRAIKSFRDVIQAYLPADQGQLLMHAAAAVMQLHGECSTATQGKKRAAKALQQQSSMKKSPVASRQSAGAAAAAAAQEMNGSRGGSPALGLSPSPRLSGGGVTKAPPHSVSATSLRPAAVVKSGDKDRGKTRARSKEGVDPALFDYTSEATMADPVGTIFHSHETRPDAVLLSRRKSVEGGQQSPLADGSGVDNSSKITGTHVESSFSPSAGAFLPNPHQATGSSATASEVQEPYPPNPEDLGEEDVAGSVSAALNSLEAAESTRRAVALQNQLRALSLVPTTPAGTAGSTATDSSSAAFSPDSQPPRNELFPEECDDKPADSDSEPNTKSEPARLPDSESVTTSPADDGASGMCGPDTAVEVDAEETEYQYFTSEEKLLLEEVMGDREYVSEEQTEAAAAAAQQAIDVGKSQDKYGASDAKMVATTTTDFFEVRVCCVQQGSFSPLCTHLLSGLYAFVFVLCCRSPLQTTRLCRRTTSCPCSPLCWCRRRCHSCC